MKVQKGGELEFERAVLALDEKISEMKTLAQDNAIDILPEIARLERKRSLLLQKVQSRLTPWNRVEIARRQGRPYSLDYIEGLFDDFVELHGDRAYGEDPAVVAGLARFGGKSVAVVAHQKGRDTKENIHRNFGMPHPEGYRKALRVMKTAARFGKPIVTLIDTMGAFPGIGAEERGQAQAIAENLLEMARLPVPIVSIVIGEGASGGALGIGVGDRLLMFENAWYGVISPEGCAAILWGDRMMAKEVAGQMKLTADDLFELGLIDRVLREPSGGAHWDPAKTIATLGKALDEELTFLCAKPLDELLRERLDKFSRIGVYQNLPGT